MTQRTLFVVGGLLALLAGGPHPVWGQGTKRTPIQVVATVGMVADVVREVGGAQVEVQTLLGNGVNPHRYQPTRSDVAALLAADMVFYSGLQLEGGLGEVLEKVGRGGKPAVAVAEAIDRASLLSDPARPGYFDPHVWMDVSAWRKTVAVVEQALSQADTANASAYAERAARYSAELDGLQAYVVRVMASIPEERRVLTTAQDAFAYFGRAYGLRVIQDASMKSENLFSDAMGPSGTYEGTYIGMIDHNATVIAKRLGGQAPERGYQDRLEHAYVP